MNDRSNAVRPDDNVYRTLLESTRAIPWRIDWKTLQFTYIGPQIEGLLGWRPESWVSVNDWAERMHPEDRDRVVNFCVSQSQAGSDHEADYRALTRDGDYVWIRDVVHVVRNHDGEVEALVGFMFDISERKRTEEQLVQLQRELEELSYRDGLTGVPNRRMFDSVVELEWEKARQQHQPLSLLLIDIDYFKQYNDEYGHLAGDDCLRAVAGALAVSARARDFVGRFGGEEFVVVLPDTDREAALNVAQRCCLHVRELALPHAGSAVSDIVTVSIGISTRHPGPDEPARNLIQQADERLYQAKDAGRDRIEAGSP